MAFTNVSITTYPATGVDLLTSFVDADQANGNQYSNTGKEIVVLYNEGGGSNFVATFDATFTKSGLALADRTVTVAANEVMVCSPLDPEVFNVQSGADLGKVHISYSGGDVANARIAVLQPG